MTTISASDVNKLRQMTGAGLMDCKAALAETGGDFESAITHGATHLRIGSSILGNRSHL